MNQKARTRTKKMSKPFIPRAHLLRILRRGIENAVLILMVRSEAYDRKKLTDVLVYMGVMVLVAWFVANALERVVTDDNVDLITSVSLGLVVALLCRMSLRFTNGRICLPTF